MLPNIKKLKNFTINEEKADNFEENSFDFFGNLTDFHSLNAPSTDKDWMQLARLCPIAVRITDTQAQAIYVNAAWSELTGTEAKDALGLGWYGDLSDTNSDSASSDSEL